MCEAPRFGTAGLSDSYRVRSFDPQAMAEYTASFGLTAFEYQCGRGVRLGLDKAAALKEAFDAKGITFSVHAPYYISMSSLEEDKRLNSVNYLLHWSRHWAAAGSSSTRAAAASRAGKPHWKRRWTPCAAPFRPWMKPVMATVSFALKRWAR